MADDKTKKGYHDRGRVSADEPYELAYLEKDLNVSREEVQQAIKKVGNNREKVEKYLKANHGSGSGTDHKSSL